MNKDYKAPKGFKCGWCPDPYSYVPEYHTTAEGCFTPAHDRNRKRNTPQVYDWTKVSREALEGMACALSDWQLNGRTDHFMSPQLCLSLRTARSETTVPPPRSRSEVDADIAETVRKGFLAGAKFGNGTGDVSHHYACRLRKLVQERTGE